MRKFGFHLSIAGSLSNAPLEAKEMGYGAFQIFVSNSRSWKSRLLTVQDIDEFSAALSLSNALAFAHVPYICNPSSPVADVLSKSIELLKENIRRCELLGVRGLVIHVGSHKGKGSGHGVRQTAESLASVLDGAKHVKLLLENSAGYVNSVGSTFDELGRILDVVGSEKVGICFDTCHAFAAGYDLVSEKGIASMVEQLERHIGMKRVHLIHLNDSKYGIGSGLDRHWHIGKGKIGTEGFVNLFRNPAFSSGSFVMETPIDTSGDNVSDMATVREIIKMAEAKGI